MKKEIEVFSKLVNNDSTIAVALGFESENFALKAGDVVKVIVVHEEKKLIQADAINQYASLTVVDGKLRLSSPDMQPWWVWFGGDSPLPAGVIVEVVLRSGEYGQADAEYLEWQYAAVAKRSQIIAFRVVCLAEGYELT